MLRAPRGLEGMCKQNTPSIPVSNPWIPELDAAVVAPDNGKDILEEPEVRRSAGHAAHFLSRLDRVSSAEVELALSLYNDVPLLTDILHRARVPADAPRVAIALAEGDRGPYIVVTRDAKFVTCLGAGMSPNGLHVIARGQLDALSLRVERLRTKLRACLAADRTDRGSARKILGRVFQAGPALSREEFEAAAAWMPLVRHSVVPILIRMLHAHEALRFRVRKEERRTRRNSKWVNAYWQNVWAMGHLVALATEDARRLAEAFATIDPFHPKRGAELQGLDILASVLMSIAKTGVMGLMVRVVGFVARTGKWLVPSLKRVLLRTGRSDELLLTFASLGGIAHRHARLAPELRKAFASHASSRPFAKRAAAETLTDLDLALDELRARLGAALDAPDAATRRVEADGARIAKDMGAHLGAKAGPFALETQDALPSTVRRSLVANWFRNTLLRPHLVLDAVPWAASCAPAEFYLPAAYARFSQPLTSPETVLQLIGETRVLFQRTRRPDVGRPRIGRNAPCACASGKKSKRCCGRDALPPPASADASNREAHERAEAA